jgi:hypothetical protein
MHLAKTVPRVWKDLFQCGQEPGLFITERDHDRQTEVGNRLQEFGKGGVILPREPTTAQSPAVMEFAHNPQLGFTAFWHQAVESQDQAGGPRQSREVGEVFAFVTGE